MPTMMTMRIQSRAVMSAKPAFVLRVKLLPHVERSSVMLCFCSDIVSGMWWVRGRKLSSIGSSCAINGFEGEDDVNDCDVGDGSKLYESFVGF